MNQDKPMANVMFDDADTLVIKGTDGAEQTFHLNTNRAMSLHIDHLEVCKHPGNQAGLGDDRPEWPPAPSFYVRGRATIDGGSVSVMGTPANTSSVLGIDFSLFNEDTYKKQQEWARECGTTARYTQATLGLVHGQQSVSTSDDWFVECELDANALRGLAGEVRSGRVQAMTMELALGQIYSDDWAHPQDHTSWFLRPNRRDNNGDSPTMARGDVTSLHLEQASLTRRRELEARAALQEFESTKAALRTE
ncbi:MAG: hypothetical protein ABI040_07310 [Rhodoferax sp.]